MRITIILPFINLRGGVQIALDLADQLVGMGDFVQAIWPTRLKVLPGFLNELEYMWRAPYKWLTCRWYDTRARVRSVPSLEARYIPDGDVVIAIAWQTAPWVASLPPSAGIKVYFIQEPETQRDPDGCAATYRLPFDLRITISDWTRSQLETQFGVKVDAVTPEGLDLLRFPPRQTGPAERVTRIGMLYDKDPKKGFDDGLAAFLAAKEKEPDLELHLLGVPRRPPSFPPFVRTHFHVSHSEKVRLYHSTDVWLAPSRQEGWGLVPMEAMACGNAVVTTRVGGTPYFAIDGETALVVEPGDRDGLARALTRLIGDELLRIRLTQRGTDMARAQKIETMAAKFRQALEQRIRRPNQLIITPGSASLSSNDS